MDDNEVNQYKKPINTADGWPKRQNQRHLPHPQLQPQRDMQWQLNTLNQ
jgi:hypothetical protein